MHLKAQHGWARFVSMQDHYNLLAREEEREMIPLCLDEGIGTIVWSPLARGRLARARDEANSTRRAGTDGADRRRHRVAGNSHSTTRSSPHSNGPTPPATTSKATFETPTLLDLPPPRRTPSAA
jgi:aryl-alcohol dehydrogenase-like predicted oxidoreductase